MLSTYLLSLREGLEAALIIGIVLGALSKIRRQDLKPAVWFGTFGAVAVPEEMTKLPPAMETIR